MKRSNESVLTALLNLHCEHGHRWFSPWPEVFADGNHECGYPVALRAGRPPSMCRMMLRRIRRKPVAT